LLNALEGGSARWRSICSLRTGSNSSDQIFGICSSRQGWLGSSESTADVTLRSPAKHDRRPRPHKIPRARRIGGRLHERNSGARHRRNTTTGGRSRHCAPTSRKTLAGAQLQPPDSKALDSEEISFRKTLDSRNSHQPPPTGSAIRDISDPSVCASYYYFRRSGHTLRREPRTDHPTGTQRHWSPSV
jgi:hypothetical protein